MKGMRNISNARNKKFLYRAFDLEGNELSTAYSAPEMAKLLGVTIDMIYQRVERKVNRNSMFRNNKYKFNITRTRL